MRTGIRHNEALRMSRDELPLAMESIVAEQVRALGFDPSHPETIREQCPPGWDLVMVSSDSRFAWHDELPGIYRDHFVWEIVVEVQPTQALVDERNTTCRLDDGFWPTRDGAGR